MGDLLPLIILGVNLPLTLMVDQFAVEKPAFKVHIKDVHCGEHDILTSSSTKCVPKILKINQRKSPQLEPFYA